MTLSDELERLAKDATPGPWQRNGSHVYGDGPGRYLIAQFIGTYGDLVSTADLIVLFANNFHTIIAALRKDGK
jgi:hypothetical protein